MRAVASRSCSAADQLVRRGWRGRGSNWWWLEGDVVKEKWKINALGATRCTAELAMLLTFPINLFTVSLSLSYSLLPLLLAIFLYLSLSFLVYLLFRDTAKVSSRSSPRFRLPLFLRRCPPSYPLPPSRVFPPFTIRWSPLSRDSLFLDHLFPALFPLVAYLSVDLLPLSLSRSKLEIALQ